MELRKAKTPAFISNNKIRVTLLSIFLIIIINHSCLYQQIMAKCMKSSSIPQPSQSCGYDEISVKLLKQNFIMSPLTHIYNLSLISGIFPNSPNLLKMFQIIKRRPIPYRKLSAHCPYYRLYTKSSEKNAFNRVYTFLINNYLLFFFSVFIGFYKI